MPGAILADRSSGDLWSFNLVGVARLMILCLAVLRASREPVVYVASL
jgi:hypothetical protein